MNVYEDLGVRRVVNAYGNLTTLGGSLMPPEVIDAMAEASRWFVEVPGLLERAGQKIAKRIGVEAAFVTSGASAGLALSTAACVAGRDPSKITRLPDTTGMKSDVILHKCQRNEWDQAIRLVGVNLVEVGLAMSTHVWDLESAIGDNTAAIVYFVDHNEDRALPLATVIEVAKASGVPVIVDAAAELPPVENLHAFADMGADLVVFSGGKMIRGPQSSGLILGCRELVEACAANASPNLSIGRPMKVGKEEIVGLVKAVELFMARDTNAEIYRWNEQVSYLFQEIRDLPGVRCRRVPRGEDDVLPRDVPRVHVSWDAGTIDLKPTETQRRLLEGEPSVAVGVLNSELVLNPVALEDGEEKIVARCVTEVLQRR
jgi:L-seryl-tRNA(Ser) seleniumtransferase